MQTTTAAAAATPGRPTAAVGMHHRVVCHREIPDLQVDRAARAASRSALLLLALLLVLLALLALLLLVVDLILASIAA